MLISRRGQLHTPWCMIRTAVQPESKQQTSTADARTDEHTSVFLFFFIIGGVVYIYLFIERIIIIHFIHAITLPFLQKFTFPYNLLC